MSYPQQNVKHASKEGKRKKTSMTTSEIVPKPSKVDHTQEELKEGKGNKIPSADSANKNM